MQQQQQSRHPFNEHRQLSSLTSRSSPFLTRQLGEAGDDDGNDDESSQGPPDSLDGDEMDVDKPAQEAQEGSRKRRKRELTTQQRTARARYMKFYRSVRSVLAANIFNQTNSCMHGGFYKCFGHCYVTQIPGCCFRIGYHW